VIGGQPLTQCPITAQRRTGTEQSGCLLQKNHGTRCLTIATARLAAKAIQGSLHRLEVGQHQFSLDGLHIRQSVHTPFHMDDTRRLEAAHHMGDGLGLADVGQETITQPMTLGRTGHQASDVHQLHLGRNDPLGTREPGQGIEACVGHHHHATVGLDGAKGIVFCRYGSTGQGIEQGRLADVGEAHDPAAQRHLRQSPVQD
jgi:hypothetical protein